MSEIINNRERRIQTLKEIIRSLHRGAPSDLVRRQMNALVREASASEIVEMEQQLMSEGMSVDEIRALCDVHAQVVHDVLRSRDAGDLPPTHPISVFRRENTAIRELIGKLTRGAGATGSTPPSLADLAVDVEKLDEIDRHYARKENLLFPVLERHGITGPSRVMWAKDDDARRLVKALRDAVNEAARGDATRAQATPELRERVEAACWAIGEMIDREEGVLFPLALDAVTEEQWREIDEESPSIGFCLVERAGAYIPSPARSQDAPAPRAAGTLRETNGAIPLGAGGLTPEQLQGILKALPVDLTFVDEHDRVAFFSEGHDRIFARPRTVIGRKVQDCHPPQSIDVVNRILSDFRTGRQDVAEFWINLRGRLVHIRYFAVRDGEGAYRGTLEVTQDLTPLRALEGERRLLQYEKSAPA